MTEFPRIHIGHAAELDGVGEVEHRLLDGVLVDFGGVVFVHLDSEFLERDPAAAHAVEK